MALWEARGGSLNKELDLDHGIVEGMEGGSFNNKLEIR